MSGRSRIEGAEAPRPLWLQQAQRLAKIMINEFILIFVGVLGIEPSLHAPKARVLPIYDTPSPLPLDRIIFPAFQLDR